MDNITILQTPLTLMTALSPYLTIEERIDQYLRTILTNLTSKIPMSQYPRILYPLFQQNVSTEKI